MASHPTAAFLLKLSKHLALLACLLILSRASGRSEIGQIWILGVAMVSALLHLGGRALRMRAAWDIPAGSGDR